jgi:leucyl-tRNA synthetase
MWERIGGTGVVFRTAWPVADEALAREDEMEVPVQINGKLVTVVKLAAESGDDAIKTVALADEKVTARTAGRIVVKVIVVKGKLVNLVVK